MNKLGFAFYLGCFLLLGSCNRNPNQLANIFEQIDQEEWAWNQPIAHEFEVAKAGSKVQIYLQLRHTNSYAYENLYVLLKLRKPDGKSQSLRVGVQLADENGQWIGRGSGGTLTFRAKLNPVWVLADSGKYSLSIVQNMRDNPLKGIEDVGFEAILVK